MAATVRCERKATGCHRGPDGKVHAACHSTAPCGWTGKRTTRSTALACPRCGGLVVQVLDGLT